ncbi:hypothetical protein Ancab_004018 [Ancistrocladus abbreviatus]
MAASFTQKKTVTALIDSKRSKVVTMLEQLLCKLVPEGYPERVKCQALELFSLLCESINGIPMWGKNETEAINICTLVCFYITARDYGCCISGWECLLELMEVDENYIKLWALEALKAFPKAFLEFASSESDHASEIHSPFIRESPMQNVSIEKGEGNKKLNGTYDSSSLSNGSESLTTLSHVSEPQCKVDTVETLSKLDHKSSDEFEWSDAIKKNKNFCVARISKTKSISLDFRLSRGIAEV